MLPVNHPDMKKILAIFLFLFSTQTFSQTYTFTQSSGVYTNLSEGISAIDWEKVPIGFTFNFFRQNYDSLYVRSGGYVFFNELGFPKVVISAYDVPGNSLTSATISYELSGIAGSRIFKLEWKNALLNSNPG